MIRVTSACLEAAGHSVEEANSFAARSHHARSIRIFENPLLELVTRAHPVTPAVCFLPLMAWGVFHSVKTLGLRGSAPLFVCGWLGFSLFEYCLHRFAFHGLLREPRSRRGEMWGFLLHGYHHHFPEDPMRLVMPPVISLPIATLFAAGYLLGLGLERAIPAMCGTLGGYLALFSVHFYVHHARPTRGMGKWLRRYHLHHHHQNSNARYGVTSPLWDIAFGTTGLRPKGSAPYQKAH